MIFFSRNQYCYFAKQTSRLKMKRKITSRDYEKQQVFERLLQIFFLKSKENNFESACENAERVFFKQ